MSNESPTVQPCDLCGETVLVNVSPSEAKRVRIRSRILHDDRQGRAKIKPIAKELRCDPDTVRKVLRSLITEEIIDAEKYPSARVDFPPSHPDGGVSQNFWENVSDKEIAAEYRRRKKDRPADAPKYYGGDPLKAEWATPQWLFDVLDAEFGFGLDAAATNESAKCETFFSPEQDGLQQDWRKASQGKPVFCNPPWCFSVLTDWVKKAYEESQKGSTVVVVLPYYKSYSWYRYIVHEFAEIRQVQGIVTYSGFGCQKGNRAPTADTIIAIFCPGQLGRLGPYIDRPGKEPPPPPELKIEPPHKRPRKCKPTEHVLSVVEGDSGDLIANVAKLYLRPGYRIADVTYGHGVFWRKLDMTQYEFHPSDLLTCQRYEGVEKADFRSLPYPDETFDVVALDPPFARHDFGWFGHRYQTDKIKDNVLDLYRAGIAEAQRVLKRKGVLLVKCQDEKAGEKQRRNTISIWEIATKENGMLDVDKFLQVCPSKRLPHPYGKQRASFRAESYLWVFRKR